MPVEVLVGARFVHFAAAMLAFGAAVFPFYAGVAARFPMRAVAALAVVSALVWLACTVLSVEGVSVSEVSLDDVGVVLLQTGFGRAWMVHLALGLALIVASLFRGPLILAVVAGANLVSLVGIGHAAAGSGGAQIAHAAAYMAHLCAGAIWLGGLVPLWRACAAADADGRKQLVRRFSAIGYGAVALVLLTGIANTRFVTGAYLPSWRHAYGQLLTLKVGLVAALVAIALFNQFVAVRRGKYALLRAGIGGELVAFGGILIVVGLLGVTSPM